MTKKKNSNKSLKLAIVLFTVGLVLELTSLIVSLALGHPYKDVCPAVTTSVPDICLFISSLALLASIAAYATATTVGRKNFVLQGSIWLFVLILCLAWPILIHAGAGINWCPYLQS
jgi:hypothetical protein